jgi:uncharacterized damage-inducible protein DinB
MPEHMSLHISGFPGEPMKTPVPGSMKTIAEVYSKVAESFIAEVSKLNAMALAMTYSFYGETWTGANALYILVAHQTHHRAQMTVLMRQAHLKIPGMYGPTKEQWPEFGMPVPMV